MLSESNREAIHGLVLAKKQMKGGLLPILHDIQDLVGYIPEQSVAVIAKELNLSRAEVHGVITFYHYFRQAKTGKNIVQICRAEACRSMGSESLWEHACSRLKVDSDAGTDAECSVHAVYCLGLCSSSPAMSINDKVYARVDADKFDRLLAITRTST
ncbi:MAG: NAD(P)H-dependent oxidoreductase subunit E [Undibacterium sp.]|nr:NAD(P)H-dependent oxidoreductase subunit E [Undibacterium sp.]